jgi:pantoate--beta-alanine ligase
VQIIRDLDTLRATLFSLRKGNGRIALVPTMGALHDGHMSLIRAARAHADHVVTSIFVNPRQFGANEDLDAYPRREAQDAVMLEAEGVELLWLPAVDVMYPPGFATNITVSGVSEGLCGAARPGHFDGVATVVCKLFNQVRPDVALFGEKDYQQLTVIRRMATDLNMELEIIGVPTMRAEDGLALSSRNAYLSEDERAQAAELPRAMREAIEIIEGGGAIPQALEGLKQRLTQAGFAPVEYAELRDATTVEPQTEFKGSARLLVAARLGKTRLIDNMPLTSVN